MFFFYFFQASDPDTPPPSQCATGFQTKLICPHLSIPSSLLFYLPHLSSFISLLSSTLSSSSLPLFSYIFLLSPLFYLSPLLYLPPLLLPSLILPPNISSHLSRDLHHLFLLTFRRREVRGPALRPSVRAGGCDDAAPRDIRRLAGPPPSLGMREVRAPPPPAAASWKDVCRRA